MDSFFNVATAASLQYFTFPLEVIGLTLAAIEVRFPNTTRRIANLLGQLASPLDELRSQATNTAGVRPETRAEGTLARAIAWLFKVAFGLVVASFVFVTVRTWLASGFDWQWVGALAVSFVAVTVLTSIVVPVVVVVVYFVVVSTSDFSRRFVEGRAVGTLGILIAGIGVAGEGYQLVTQMTS